MNQTIIDVRTPEEFSMGHIQGSLNMPLQELTERINEIKRLNSYIIVCCASGVRSAKAYQLLQQNGISNITNGGSWMDVEKKVLTQ